MDWSESRSGPLQYSEDQFARARDFVFRMWCEWAEQRQAALPTDLSGACKYGSLFTCRVFGGAIHGHYQHQFNDIHGVRVDLSQDACDVAAMAQPYLHEPLYFAVPEVQASLQRCLPRVDRWVARYLAEQGQRGAAPA